jgi:acetolactate synthase-1/2/3 large subunit
MSFRYGASMATVVFFDKRYASTEMTNPNFVAIAEGYYIAKKR